MQPLWANVPPAARARYLRRAARALLDDLDEIALLLAAETGRPRTEAVLGELLPAVAGLSALADDGPKALADRRLGRPALLRGGRRAFGVQSPRGVIGILGGASSPWTEPALEVGAALLAGNGVVLVPAAPLAAERLRAVFLRGGIPDELLAVAHGEPAAAALADATARVVSVAAPSAKGAMLVLQNAAIERVAAAALWASFAHGGRHPAAVSRLVCVPSVADALVAALAGRARGLRVGDPRRPEAEVGPLASPDDLAAIEALVREAIAGGAELVCGGPTTVPGLSGAFYAPAVLRRVPAGRADPARARARAGAGGGRGARARPRRSRTCSRRRPCRPTGRRSPRARRAPPATAAPAAAWSACGRATGRRASGWRGSSAPSWCG